MQKPREMKIQMGLNTDKATVVGIEAHDTHFIAGEVIHVVEYWAYNQAIYELDKAKAQRDEADKDQLFHKKKNQQLTEDLKTAVKYLREGKAKFTPNTDNSFVDDFLTKYKDL